MILHPPVIALLAGSGAVAGTLLYAARHGVRILRHWDLGSGSERQLELERRTYLVTTLLTWTLVFELLSLLLFIRVADELSHLFVGAMCAAGSLALNGFGYPALLLKIASFLLAGLWLVVNTVDNRARDYPMIRLKYRLLLVLAPLVVAAALAQALYFLQLEPNVITSCCGSLFGGGAGEAQAGLFALPRGASNLAFAGVMASTLATGAWFLYRGRPLAGYLFSACGTSSFGVTVAAFVSSLCLYFYELPTHHCPFCVIQAEYGHVGYLLYLLLLGGAVGSLGVGFLLPYRGVPSLAPEIARAERRLTLASLALYGAFAATVAYRMAASDLAF